MSVLETYHKHIKVGDSEGWCGPSLMVVVLRPFTPGEDAIITWACAQDDAELLEVLHLQDGRDYIVLARRHTKQTLQAALAEQQAFLSGIPMQRGTTDTPMR
jgi:hypothetical protein